MRTLVAFLVLAGLTHAGEPTPAQWLDAGRHESEKSLKWYNETIKQIESDADAVQRRPTFVEDAEPHFVVSGSENVKSFACENRVMQQVYLGVLRRRILDLKSQRARLRGWVAPALTNLRVGEFGYIIETSTHSAPSALLATPEKMSKAERYYKRFLEHELIVSERSIASAEVFQVLDGTSLLAKLRRDVVKIEGVSTDGLTDGAYFLFTEPMYVAGTTTYQAAIGSNTVFVLKPISKETQVKLDAAVTDAVKSPYEPRKWSDISGKFKTTAELVDFDGKTVWLKKEDGTESKVPFSKLSKADKEYVQEQLGAP